MVHPVIVPVFLQHILEPLQPDDIGKGQNVVAQNFVRRMVHINVIVLGGVVPQPRAAQHLEKTEL
ncbi:hypothetical protein D1872_333010 [compost metagenome]